MKRIVFGILLVILTISLPACDVLGLRPVYPATFTPLPASPTRPLTTLAPTKTPAPTEIFSTATPRASGLFAAWAVNQPDQTFIAVDPVTMQVLSTIPIDGIPLGVITGEGSIWALEGIDSEHSNVLRIDPYTNQISSRIPVTDGETISIAAGSGAIWVGVARELGINKGPGGGVEFSRRGAILRIDPQSNQIVETIETDAMPAALEIEDQVLWVLEKTKSYSYMNKVDLETRTIFTVPDSIQSADYIHKFDDFVKMGVWLWMTPQDASAQYLIRVSSLDGIIDSSVSLGKTSSDSPAQVTSDGEYIWAALRSGSVVKVDPVTKQVKKTITTQAAHLSQIFFTSGYIWALGLGDSLLFQIDPNTDEIINTITTGSIPLPSPTPTATVTPDPNLIWALCNEAFTTHLRVGINAVVNNDPPIPNRVRIEPNSEALILGYIQPGERVEILTGPVCFGGWVWWNVISLSSGLTGWTSEGDGIDYWLLPAN